MKEILPICVRRARPEDAADFARLMADPGVCANLMQLPLPGEAMCAKPTAGR